MGSFTKIVISFLQSYMTPLVPVKTERAKYSPNQEIQKLIDLKSDHFQIKSFSTHAITEIKTF